MKTEWWKGLLVLVAGVGLLLTTNVAHAGTVVTYVHTDHLGSPVAETNSLGNVTWRRSHSPYGEDEQGPTPDGPGYTGHRNDAATGLVYMQARYYDPEIRRFLSVDPVTFSADKPQHFNRYWYANGNPYSNMDPDGRDPERAFRAAVNLSMSPERAAIALSAESKPNFVGSTAGFSLGASALVHPGFFSLGASAQASITTSGQMQLSLSGNFGFGPGLYGGGGVQAGFSDVGKAVLEPGISFDVTDHFEANGGAGLIAGVAGDMSDGGSLSASAALKGGVGGGGQVSVGQQATVTFTTPSLSEAVDKLSETLDKM